MKQKKLREPGTEAYVPPAPTLSPNAALEKDEQELKKHLQVMYPEGLRDEKEPVSPITYTVDSFYNWAEQVETKLGIGGRRLRGDGSEVRPENERRLGFLPHAYHNVSICHNNTRKDAEFKGPSYWQRYFSFVTLAQFTTGG